MSDINLNKHGVIEAHAGTGKTWTIINDLVLPILMGEGCARTHIREVLLVTYTEKAAGELKKRIRDGIEKKIAEISNLVEYAELKQHLEDCLNNLHESLIGTIHGVCLRLLQSYPFETGMQFTTEMVEDEEGIRTCLRESIREDWPQWGVDLSILGGAVSFEGDSGLLSRITEVARECLDPDSVLCTLSLGPEKDLGYIINEIHRKRVLASELISLLESKIDLLEDLSRNPAGLSDDQIETIKGILNQWKSVLLTQTLKSKSEILCGGRSSGYLSNQLKKNNASDARQRSLIGEVCQAYKEVIESDQFKSWIEMGNPEAELQLALVIKAVPQICKRWREKKDREGLISFQDMLKIMCDAVCDNSQFRHLLRSRIRFAIIDEFQDTSALQWEIFRQLFVDRHDDGFSPRMFIVGDPKQSIYSFQNAVVESYLEARESILKLTDEAQEPILRKMNYRSLPKVVEGYNRIFTSNPETSGFFISDRIQYTDENHVLIPVRNPLSEENLDLLKKPVQIVPLHGSSSQRKRKYAEFVSSTIASLKGTSLVLPKGDAWEETVLDYHHFAVIAESHSLADKFLKILLDHDIPAAKYKQEGVFESVMAIEFRAVLNAIFNHKDSLSNKLKALLTSFFNYAPDKVDPETVLNPGGKISRIFQTWQELAEERAWSQLFRNILRESRVQERLIRLIDGDRRICDLRQVMDHSLEYLIKKQCSGSDLIEHLANLESGLEKPGRDQNLHSKESDKRKVQVMTMHASKGLEFPVCFVVTGGSSGFKGRYRRWTEVIDGPDNKNRNLLHVMPVISSTLDQKQQALQKVNLSEMQQNQERRRLLYVAMTRPKAVLFVPMHLESGRQERWKDYSLPKYGKEEDLTPILQSLADESSEDDQIPIGVCNPDKNLFINSNSESFTSGNLNSVISVDLDEKLTIAEQNISEALSELKLSRRRRIQTSYTALAHEQYETADLEGRRTRDHDFELNTFDESDSEKKQTDILPAGKHTGNALHEIIEFAMSHVDGIGWASSEVIPDFLKTRTTGILATYGITHQRKLSEVETLNTKALYIVQRALSQQYTIPDYGIVQLCNLQQADIRAEAEFHLGIAPHWILGYMDVVFRVKNPDNSYRYFVLDWKSNHLSSYDKASIEMSILECRYDIQAKIYCHGLHAFLSGILGQHYDPSTNLGGALYVYLRGLEHKSSSDPVWFYRANPDKDSLFVESELKQYAKKQGAYGFTD